MKKKINKNSDKFIMKSIKFGNKKVLQIVSNDMKNVIKNKIKASSGMEITIRYYNFLNEKNMHLLKNNEYKVCINTFGHKYLLFLTKYNNKNYCIFINKKREDMIHIRFRFSDELFSNTLFDGELIKNNDNDWIYAISDIISYKNNCVIKNKSLNERQELLQEILNKEYIKDNILDFCIIDLKEYFELKYLDDIYKRYIESVPYKCSGIYFQHYTDYKKGFMYIFPEFRTNTDSNILSNNNTNNSLNTISNINTNNTITNKSKELICLEPNKKYPFNFQIKQTDLPDIYQLYYNNNAKLINYGYAGVPDMVTSKLLLHIFDTMCSNNNEEVKVVVVCEYSEKFNKWVPKKITNKDVGDVYKYKKI